MPGETVYILMARRKPERKGDLPGPWTPMSGAQPELGASESLRLRMQTYNTRWPDYEHAIFGAKVGAQVYPPPGAKPNDR